MATAGTARKVMTLPTGSLRTCWSHAYCLDL